MFYKLFINGFWKNRKLFDGCYEFKFDTDIYKLLKNLKSYLYDLK
jgi:hypothetical protein